MKNWIKKHSAGATVSHKSNYSILPSPQVKNELSEEDLLKYVSPFYLTNIADPFFKECFLKIQNDITPELCYKLLGTFDWRSRICGAYFSMIKNYYFLTGTIGNLLLKSEVCYAGRGYLLALAKFNNNEAIEYISLYLDYYLKKKDLWFEQGCAMSALAYLDDVNSTDLLSSYLKQWKKFVKNKSNWSLEGSNVS